MPTYRVELDDGRAFDVEADSEPTEMDIQEFLVGQTPKATAPSLGETQAGLNFGLPTQQGSLPVVPSSSVDAVGAAKALLPLAAGIVAPEMAAARIPALAPAAAKSLGGYLGRLAGSGALSGGAMQGTQEAIGAAAGEPTEGAAGRILGSMTLGALSAPILGPLTQKLLQTGIGAVTGGYSGLQQALAERSLAPLIKGAKTGATLGFVRPLFHSTTDDRIASARNLIKAVTGEEPPMSVGEALGKRAFGGSYVDLEKELGESASGAISEETRNRISRSIMHTASQLFGTGATREQIADLTIAALNKEVTRLGKPAEEAVRQLTDDLISSIDDELSKIGGEALKSITPTAAMTARESGDYAKLLAESAQKAFRDQQDALFSAYRSQLGAGAVTPGLPNAKAAVSQLLNTGLRETSKEGIVTPIARTIQDADARSAIDTILKAADTPQDIESLRRYISQFSDDITYGVLSKIPDANKKALRAALKQDLMEGLNSLPTSAAKDALIKANRFTTEAIDDILNPSINKAAQEANVGGTAGEDLFRRLTTRPTEYRKFVTALGGKADEFKQVLREGILTDVSKVGGPVVGMDQTVNVGKAFSELSKLPKEISDDLGFDLELLRKLALRQEAVKELAGKAAKVKDLGVDKAFEWLNVSKDEMLQFAGPNGPQRFADLVRVKGAQEMALRNAILADVAAGSSAAIRKNPADFVRQIVEGAYRPADTQKALQIVAADSPKTYHDIQVEFLKNLIDGSTVKGVVSGERIAQKIGAPVGGKAPTSGGELLDTANAILGKSKVDSVRRVAEALGQTQKRLLGKELSEQSTFLELATSRNVPRDILYAFASKLGATKSLGWVSSLLNSPAQMRYSLAASLLNEPQYLPLLSKPFSELTGAEAAALVNAVEQSAVRSE